MSLNRLTLSGHLAADSVLRAMRNGTPVLSFALGVGERVPDGAGGWTDYTSWPECVMFGKRAEALAPILRKGTKIALEGRIRTRSYEKDGQRRKVWEVRVDDVELLQYKRDRQGSAPEQPMQAPDVYDEDIPF